MKTTAHIKVSTKVGNLLNTREAADSFMDFVSTSVNSDIVELDFEQVEFMSRSFADQFHKIRTRLLAESKFSAIDIVNASPVVIEMLQIVSTTQNKTNRDYETFPVYKFKEVNALQKFLSAL